MTFKPGNKARKGKFLAPDYFEKKKVTKQFYVDAISKYMSHNVNELKALLDAPGQVSALEEIIIAALIRDRNDGSIDNAERLISRIHGKVPDKVEFNDVTDQAEIDRLKAEYKKIMRKPE